MDREEKILYKNLHGFDDKTVMAIAAEYPALYKTKRERIMKLCVNKTPVSFFKVDNIKSDVQTVTGTEIYHRPLWRKYMSSAAAVMLIAAGLGCMTYISKNADINNTPDNNMFNAGIVKATENTSESACAETECISSAVSTADSLECTESPEKISVTDISSEVMASDTEICTDCETVSEYTEDIDSLPFEISENIFPQECIPDNSITFSEKNILPTEQETAQKSAFAIEKGEWYCLEDDGTFVKYYFYDDGDVLGYTLNDDLTIDADIDITDSGNVFFRKMIYNNAEDTTTEVTKSGVICIVDNENFIILWDGSPNFDIFSRNDFFPCEETSQEFEANP